MGLIQQSTFPTNRSWNREYFGCAGSFGRASLAMAGCEGYGFRAIFTERNIIIDMAQNTEPNPKSRDILRRNMAELAHRVIKKLSGQDANVKGLRKLTGEEKQKRKRNNLLEVQIRRRRRRI